jgi:hypothetical protein
MPDGNPFASAAVVLGRVVQVMLAGLAAVTILGSLVGGANVLVFAAVSLFALVLLAFVGVVEAAVRGVKGWVA